MVLEQDLIRYIHIPDPAAVIMEADHINIIILVDRSIAGPELAAVVPFTILLAFVDSDLPNSNRGRNC